jgi:hypothetical protein
VQGGGVGFYVKDNLRYNVLLDRVIETIISEVWISPNKKIIVGSIYRPNVNHPTLTSSQQFEQFFELFTNLMEDLTNQNVPVFLFGDFNLDVLKYNIVKQVTEYVDLLFSYGCIQLVMKPTRCTATSATLIDHLITNFKSQRFETVIITNKISDHYPFLYFYEENKTRMNHKMSHYRDFSDLNVNNFIDSVNVVNWEFLQPYSTQDAYDQFSDTFFSLYNLYFPLITTKLNKKIHKLNPWITKGILVSRLKKIELCKMASRFQSEFHVQNFKNYRNLYNKVVKLSKKLFYQQELKKYQCDAKKTWEILRKAINNVKQRDNSIQHIVKNGNKIFDPMSMAQEFNLFFVNVAKDVISSIPETDLSIQDFPALNVSNEIFKFTDVNLTRTEIVEAISALKSKTSLDSNGLLSNFIKKIAYQISYPLFIFFLNRWNRAKFHIN